MTSEDIARYTELVAKMQRGTLTKDEKPLLSRLAAEFAEHQAATWEAERQAANEAVADELAARREAAEWAKAEAELGHQLSWLKASLNVKVTDEMLEAQWKLFKTAVEKA